MQHSEQDRIAHSTPTFVALPDLASARVGGRAIAVSDDFFAPKSNLIKPEAAIFVPDKFTTRGKWMDGWESRRRRTPGHDWCIVRLGIRGRIAGVDVDTSFFTGNYPSHCSIDALDASRPITQGHTRIEALPWRTIQPQTSLVGDAHNYFAIQNPGNATSVTIADGSRTPREAAPQAWTHVRLNIFPDGGVARLRVYGEAEVDWDRIRKAGRTVDLAAIQHGGRVLCASNMHFGGKDNMIMPGRAKNMGDGWETKRRRGPGYDWAIVRLGTTGIVTRIEIDTNHFKGNYPDSASVEGCDAPGTDVGVLSSMTWSELLPQTKLRAHRRHFYSRELRHCGPVSHVRLNIFPDGGISRLRVHGTVATNR